MVELEVNLMFVQLCVEIFEFSIMSFVMMGTLLQVMVVMLIAK